MSRKKSDQLQNEARELADTIQSRTRTLPTEDGPSESEVSVHECPSTTDGRVTYIARLMSLNLYRSGRTPEELCLRWGMSLHGIQQMAVEAGRITRLSIHADDLARGINESIAELREIAIICRRRGDMREAIVANKAAGDLCQTLLTNAAELFNRGKALTPASATKALVEAGWKPPNTLVGLPSPDWIPTQSVVEAKGVETDGNEDSEKKILNTEHG